MSSRHFDFRLALGLPLLLMALLLLIDPSPLDFALARLFYEPGQGFIGRSSFWLEDILHDRAKQALILLGSGFFVISMVDNLLRPRLVGRSTQIPDWVIMVTTLGGLSLIGGTGIVLGPMIAGITLALWQMTRPQPGDPLAETSLDASKPKPQARRKPAAKA